MDDWIKKLPITSTKDSQDAKGFARGIMLTPKEKVHVEKSARTLEFALDQPLGNALESIFSHQGNVLITFPSASDFKVSL